MATPLIVSGMEVNLAGAMRRGAVILGAVSAFMITACATRQAPEVPTAPGAEQAAAAPEEPVGLETPGTSQWDGVYTVAQANRGEPLYGDMCSVCHGAQLGGADFGPELLGEFVAAQWNDLPLAELYYLIRDTMPANAPGTLTGQEAADLLAFILHKGNYPDGTHELPADAESLKSYTFLASNPDSER